MKPKSVIFSRTALVLSLALILSPYTAARATPEDQNLADQKMLEGGQSVVSTQIQANGHRWVQAKILIKAPPHVVWDTVHEERKHDPELAYSKMISQDHDQSTLEQKFSVIPIIGTAVCVMKNTEVPDQRIDYSMLSSDRFKAFEGSWVLSPGLDANSTYLELSSYCDTGLPIPRTFVEGVTAKKLQRRLVNVKNMAESIQTRLAHATKPADQP